jgi:hypothetical protein
MNNIPPILPAHLLYLLLLLSCGSQTVTSKMGEVPDLTLVQDSIVPSKDTSSVWFPLDTVPFLIAEQFSHIAKLGETIILQDNIIRQKKLLIRKSVLEIDGHIVSYTALFNKDGNDGRYGEARNDNYLSAKIKFDHQEFDFEQTPIISIDPEIDTFWHWPITFAPDGEYLSDSVYAKIQLGDKKYYILNTGSASCGICADGKFLIFELNTKKGTDIKLHVFYRRYGTIEDTIFGDCNHDNILDFYLIHELGHRSYYSLVVPVTLAPINKYLLAGSPIYFTDSKEEKAKIYTGNSYDIIGK